MYTSTAKEKEFFLTGILFGLYVAAFIWAVSVLFDHLHIVINWIK